MQREMGRLAWRRAWTLAAAGIAAVAAALVVWVVPAFSGGTAGKWTWVSGAVFQDNAPDFGTAVMVAYNGGSEPQEVTVRGIEPGGATVAPTTSATATIQPGKASQWSWDCVSGFGCQHVYELTTASDDVVPSLIIDEVATTGLTYAGLVPPGAFTVFGPDGNTVDSTAQSVSGATAALQAEADSLQGDAAQVKADTAQLKADTAKLRKDNKKLRKQLKRVLKAVR